MATIIICPVLIVRDFLGRANTAPLFHVEKEHGLFYEDRAHRKLPKTIHFLPCGGGGDEIEREGHFYRTSKRILARNHNFRRAFLFALPEVANSWTSFGHWSPSLLIAGARCSGKARVHD